MNPDGLKELFPELGGRMPVFAGPCSAESARQTLDAAEALSAEGISLFRAGVWKPRTKPGGFEGIGSPALRWLAEVKRTTGMKVGTEVANSRHVREALDAGMDFLWLGARTVANPFAVQEIADELSTLDAERLDSLAVLVKNPVNPDIELWIGGIERVYGSGIRRLGAIHRGFSLYGPHIYRNPPEWRIPIELKRRLPGLPVICDPSHIGGRRELIEPLSQQAMDLNFDGLIIESHCNPDCALSDAAQQVTPRDLGEILRRLVRHGETGTTESLEELRREIDHIDRELIELLARRMAVTDRVGRYKKEHNMPVVQPDRYNALMQRRTEEAAQLDIDRGFMSRVLAEIHQESVRRQLDL